MINQSGPSLNWNSVLLHTRGFNTSLLSTLNPSTNCWWPTRMDLKNEKWDRWDLSQLIQCAGTSWQTNILRFKMKCKITSQEPCITTCKVAKTNDPMLRTYKLPCPAIGVFANSMREITSDHQSFDPAAMQTDQRWSKQTGRSGRPNFTESSCRLHTLDFVTAALPRSTQEHDPGAFGPGKRECDRCRPGWGP